jgi:16S rRNA (cytosine967-C5)-methyltransferase
LTVTAARRCAIAVVRRVFEEDAYADRAFRAEADRLGLRGRDRAFAMRLAYGTIQRKATLDYIVERLTGRALRELDAPVLAALRLGLYQVLFLGGVADHAAVGESVELAKANGGGGHRLVNAALRRATREGREMIESLTDDTPPAAALKHSHPDWIAELWWERLGRGEALALMERDNHPAESAVRANTLRIASAELVDALADAGVPARADARLPEAVVLEAPYDVHASALFERGLLMPQSRASMTVARALAPRPGERVLDLCAAPGAKTTHLAALMGDEGSVMAVELDSRRARAIEANCERLGVGSVEVIVADASEVPVDGGYDRVLVDPPCSDLGTLQSRPDARWRKSPGQVQQLRSLQERILETGAAALRPGGSLVYSTCTISPLENELLIDDFLGGHPEFAPSEISSLFPEAVWQDRNNVIQTLPHRHGTDGFFIAALDKTPG